VVYFEVVGAGIVPRVGGANERGDQEDVRPVELLGLLHC
jgi:hypothetical protein